MNRRTDKGIKINKPTANRPGLIYPSSQEQYRFVSMNKGTSSSLASVAKTLLNKDANNMLVIIKEEICLFHY